MKLFSFYPLVRPLSILFLSVPNLFLFCSSLKIKKDYVVELVSILRKDICHTHFVVDEGYDHYIPKISINNQLPWTIHYIFNDGEKVNTFYIKIFIKT